MKHIFNPLEFYVVTSCWLNHPIQTYAGHVFYHFSRDLKLKFKVTSYETTTKRWVYMETPRQKADWNQRIVQVLVKGGR